MKDIYDYYENIGRDGIILSYRGRINQELLNSIYEMMESGPDELRKKKKVYHILVESLQNIFHHTENSQIENMDSIFLICRGKEESVRIITGNPILNSRKEDLRNKIDFVNSLDAEQLRNYYLEQLNSAELSDKGGAGLGFIDMARKSGNKLQYSFHHVSEQVSFFTLEITIK